MYVVLADLRLVWRVIDYLQRDAALKGVLKCNEDSHHSRISSFWNNLDEFMPAFNENRLYVVINTRRHLIAYFITRWSLENNDLPINGTLSIDIFEVLPKHRKKGVGSFTVSWLEEKAHTVGFHSLRVLPANSSDVFWNKQGFSAWGDSHGYLLLPIA